MKGSRRVRSPRTASAPCWAKPPASTSLLHACAHLFLVPQWQQGPPWPLLGICPELHAKLKLRLLSARWLRLLAVLQGAHDPFCGARCAESWNGGASREMRSPCCPSHRICKARRAWLKGADGLNAGDRWRDFKRSEDSERASHIDLCRLLPALSFEGPAGAAAVPLRWHKPPHTGCTGCCLSRPCHQYHI